MKSKSRRAGPHAPIGVFDSGLGGLTVVKQMRMLLPGGDILYFGDLARLPYGTKSSAQIIRFSLQNTAFLLKQGIKALVVACNSSSSSAFSTLRRRFSVPMIDVIGPAVEEAVRKSRTGRIGLIATRATIESGAYEKALRTRHSRCRVFSAACPLFVPLVEEGMSGDPVTERMAERYLAPLIRRRIDTLILGCTHYPLLTGVLKKVLPRSVHLVDSARPTVEQLRKILTEKKLASSKQKSGSLRIFVSDKPRRFTEIGENFLGEKLAPVRVVRA